MLKDYKNNPTMNKGDEIAQLNNYIRTLFIFKHLKPIFKIPILSFININEPEIKHYNENWIEDFDNKAKYTEINYLKKLNPINYKYIIFINKTHYIFNKKQSANKIIKIIKQNLCV